MESIESPKLIVFFIPLPFSLGLPNGSTYRLERCETVPWLQDVLQMPVKGLKPLLNKEGRNFVSLRIWLPKHTYTSIPELYKPLLKVIDYVLGSSANVPSEAPNAPLFESYAT